MRCLELFAGQGGATRGLQRAGMHVTAVDLDGDALSRNPADVTICADALQFCEELLQKGSEDRSFDFVWASPPCQSNSRTACWGKTNTDNYPKLIEPVRNLLVRMGLPFVIENVVGAKHELIDPFMVCGMQFPDSLQVFRHRFFETNIESVRERCAVPHPPHGEHRIRDPKNVRRGVVGDFFSVAGNGGGVNWGTTDEWFCAMGYGDRSGFEAGQMTKRGLCESIPPQYGFFIGTAVVAALKVH